MHFRSLLLTVALLMHSVFCRAQQPGGYKPYSAGQLYKNGITLNFPTYVQCATFGGGSVGAEYRRILNAKSTLGASIAFTRLIWAGTAEAGDDYANGYRANIVANLLAPGVNYYPFGSKESVSLEIGALAQVGSIRRIDSYQARFGSMPTDTIEKAFFFAPQLHVGISILGYRHLLLTFYGNFGPMLACGKNTNGNYGSFGVKIGRRF